MPYTITIELRVDFDTANAKIKNPAMLKIARLSARELLTKAMMIQDTRAPTIMVSDGDFFSETADVAIFGDDEGDGT
jgi:hypothetical protein